MDVNIKWPMDRESAVDYLVGLIRGDGSLEEYRVEIYDKSKLFLSMVREIVVGKYLADLVTSTRIEHRRSVNNFRVRIYGKPFIEYIKTRYIKPVINIDFLRGFFDAEGSIWYNPNIVAEITNKDLGILKALQSLLARYNVNSKIHRDRTTYKLRITSMRKFMEHVGLRHPRHIIKVYLAPHAHFES